MTSTEAQGRKLWNARNTGLLVANTLADFGFWIDFLVILAMAAYTYQANGVMMAIVSALFLVPSMLLGARVGRWLDRNDPGHAIVIGLGLRTLVTAMLLLQPSLWLFCVCVALRSAFTIPISPGFNVVVSRVVAKDQVPGYFGGLGVMRNIVKISAPFMGTAIASYYGDASALMLSIVLSVLGLVVTLFCALGTKAASAESTNAASTDTAAQAPKPPSSQLTAPQSSLLTQFLLTVTVFAFVVFFINNQLPVLLRDAGFDKALLGALVSCSGAGGILASLYMIKRNAAMGAGDPMTATTVAVFATAMSFVVLGLVFLLPVPIAQYVAGLVFFCTGICASIEAIRSNTVIVQHFETQAGEVSGKVAARTSAAMLGAPWVAALAIPYISLSSLLILDGLAGILVLALIASRYRGAEATRRAVAS